MKRLLYSIILVIITNGTLKSQDKWSVYLGQKKYVTISHLPHYNYIPDGHISVLPDGNGKYMMFWSEFENIRTIGETQYPGSQKTLEPAEPVFGGREPDDGSSNGVNDGGSWLMSVHRYKGDTLIGFYHGESHWYPRNGNYTAWKSICVAYSYDNGFTWADSGQIITSNTPKPEERAWGGAGDCCVVWDSVNQRWNCYYQEHNIRLAVSYDPLGSPGTWKKYYDGNFNEDGMGGLSTPLNNLSNKGGANPSIHQNTYLNKMVMTYHGWDGGIYITVSNDGINWEYPRKIINIGEYNNWYPTIIGVSDTEAGRAAKLYYGEFYTSSGWRFLVERDILFDTLEFDYGYIHVPWKGVNVGNYNFSGKAGMKNDLITLTGATNNLTGTNDQLYLLYQDTRDSLEISTLLNSQTSLNNRANSGLMIRSSTNGNSPFISVSRKSNTDTIEIIRRENIDEVSILEQLKSNLAWFKISKNANNFEVFNSSDGEQWELLAIYDMVWPDSAVAGLFSTSHENSIFCTATFSNTNLIHKNTTTIIKQETGWLNFKIFPNPVHEYLNILVPEQNEYIQYNLMDMSGKIVYKTNSNKKLVVINTASLQNNNFYLLQLVRKSTLLGSQLIYKE